jgi:paraquat-inducible protein A
MNTKRLLLLVAICSVIYLVFEGKFISQSHEHYEIAKSLHEERAKLLDYSDRLLNLQEWISKNAYENKKNIAQNLQNQEIQQLDKAKWLAIYMILVGILYTLFILLLYRKRNLKLGVFISATMVGLTCLCSGVLFPMMEIEAYKTNLTVKAKVTPIETEEYLRSKQMLDSMDTKINGQMDSVTSKTQQELNGIDQQLLELKKTLISTANLVDLLPNMGGNSTDQLRNISEKIPTTQGLVMPVINDIKRNLKELKQEFRDNLIRQSDELASHTYGIHQVFPDKTYFYYQQKSILEVIHRLWEEKNYTVALALALFSIFFPVLKILLSILIAVFPKIIQYVPIKILSITAKWSMADVFVASSFLTYMSFSNLNVGVEMQTKFGNGLYFFLSYAVLSIFLSAILSNLIKKRTEKE